MVKLLRFLRKYWLTAVIAPLFMILEVSMDMVLSQYMEYMIDYGIQTSDIDNVIKYGLTMILILVVGVTCGILAGVFTNLTSYHFSNDLRKEVFSKIMALSSHQMSDFQTGSLVTRVTNDITQVQNMISMTLRGLVRALSFFVLGIVFTISISSQFAYILLVILPVEVLILFIFIKLVFPVFSRIQAKLDHVNTIVHENVSGARVVKAFSKEEYEYNRFVNANNDYTHENLYVSRIAAFLMPSLMLVIYGAQMVIYEVGGTSIFDVFNGNKSPDDMIMVGQISQAITYISMICMSIMMLGMTFSSLARASASAKRINEVLSCNIEIQNGNLDLKEITEVGEVEFQNVSFAYPLSNTCVLNDINLKISKGETVAIVGATGSGKSTLVNLLARFSDVTAGKILVDGHDIRDYRLVDLRNKVGICLQKSELFYGTIKDNICFGKEDASQEEIERAASIAQAAEFINDRENGFDELVEEKGTSLSGGQKQRISIARAILKHPEILIFDDSTSALDLVTEAKLHNEMNKYMRDVTKIIVAQRIATAKNASKILVLDKGSIAAYGSHTELLETSPIYQDIYNSQLRGDGVIHE